MKPILVRGAIWWGIFSLVLGLGIVCLPGCAPAAAPQPIATQAPAAEQSAGVGRVTQAPATQPAELPGAPAPTQASAAQPVQAPRTPVPTQAPAAAAPVQPPAASEATQSSAEVSPPPATQPPPPLILTTPTAQAVLPTPEQRMVEVEWPPSMRLGDSDVVRLSLIPDTAGYTLKTEFLEHQGQSQSVRIPRPDGYFLYAISRLDGVGFTISPEGEQEQYLPEGETVTWRWSLTPRQPGQQRLTLALKLHWLPGAQAAGPERSAVIYSQALDVRVLSFLGLTQGQAMTAALFSLLLGGGLSLFSFSRRVRPAQQQMRDVVANPALSIELRPGLALSQEERLLLQALFGRYARLVVEREFLSGYSGARVLLALPVRTDGRADAYTIAKLGSRSTIEQEYQNYENFVKDTLPPVTARIQHPPVSTAGRTAHHGGRLAALQYTFIGQPGSVPASLRQVLLANPDPVYLHRLYETFAPNWWMQRRPYTFRLAQEYDLLLPPHLVLEPCEGRGSSLPGQTLGQVENIGIGEVFRLPQASRIELRSDGRSLSLVVESRPGQPALRLRWLGERLPRTPVGRVVARRQDLLYDYVKGCELFGLPDPIPALAELLNQVVVGSQSIIHGDLNLENALAGPGEILWLIDFARTREGHALFDFAHLQAQIAAHVIATRLQAPQDFLGLLTGQPLPEHRPVYLLWCKMGEIAHSLLQNPEQPREYSLALAAACLGALKHSNLNPHSRHFLYLAAAHLYQKL